VVGGPGGEAPTVRSFDGSAGPVGPVSPTLPGDGPTIASGPPTTPNLARPPRLRPPPLGGGPPPLGGGPRPEDPA
jgi:hypothetical protein